VQKLLVVEFCDTSGPDGLYRKYSAMRIGERIIPRHLHAASSWIAKAQTSAANDDETLVREELEYLDSHPHQQWLRDVFTEAEIEYGRIDYGLYKGVPQVWEINTNPTLGRGRHRKPARQGPLAALREPGRLASHKQMLDAFKCLERPDPAPRVTIVLPAPVSVRLRAETQVHRRAAASETLRRVLLHSPVSQSLKGAVRPLLARIAPAVARVVRNRA